MRLKSRIPRAISLLLSFALIQVSFGPEAWAQLVPEVGAIAAPVGGGSAASGSFNAQAPSSALSLRMPAASVFGSPTAMVPSAFLAAPSAAPSIPVSAIGAPAQGISLAAATIFHGAAPAAVAAPRAAAALSGGAAASFREKGDDAAKPSAQAPAAAPADGTSLGYGPAAGTSPGYGPNSGGAASRIARRFAELKNFFTGRRDAEFPDSAAGSSSVNAALRAGALNSSRMTGLSLRPSGSASVDAALKAGALRSKDVAAVSTTNDKVAQGGGDNAPPAAKKSKAAWFGLGAAGASIIAYALTMQVGLEAQGVAMPQLTENAFKDFTLLPLVTVFASIGSMIGQPMSKFFTERFGLAKTFYAAHALRAISLGAMVVLFGTGMMSMPLMMGFYLLNGVVTGVAATAEGTLKKLILAEKGVSQQSYRTWWQLIAETLAVPAPIIFGALVHSLGLIGAPLITAIYPVTILLGLLLAYILKVYPLKDVKKASDQAAAQSSATAAAPKTGTSPVPAEKKGIWKGIKSAAATIFKNMEEGKNFVMRIPYLKYSLMGAVAFDLFNVIIYRLISPGYGKLTGGAAGLSAVQGNIVGMFSLGGLLLSVVFITMESIAKKRAAKNAGTPEAAAAAERSSMLRWAMLGIPAIALLATMAVHVALPFAPLIFLGTNWMPSSMLAAALIPFGFFQVAASIKLNSYFQEKLPQDAGQVQKALAFAGSVMTAMSIITMLAMRPLFSAVTVFNPFPWLAMALVPIGIGVFFLIRKLASATKPEAIAAADAAQRQREANEGAPKTTSGYVGLILGIVAAAVVITALPMIPAAGVWLAGLGVLAKFGVNLGLTLLIPLAGYLIARARGRSKAAQAAKKTS